ncbi:MAG: glutamine synthetase family protein [Candidatus Binatia bacterium]|nr:glutamine synthetase family protein [Candidatus Binatia bacterium]
MQKNNGMLDVEKLAALVDADEVDTIVVGFSDLYGRLLGKRLDARFFLDSVAREGTHGCDYLLTVDMEMEPVGGYKYANWEKGYGDFHLVPDLPTLRRVDWLEKTAMVLCDVLDDATHGPVPFAPRSLLRAQIGVADALGFEVEAASELEYYIFETSYREAAESGFSSLKPAGWYLEDYHTLQGTRVEKLNAVVRRHLSRSGVPVESSKGEWGLGQHELNVRHSRVLEMADRHTVYKQCLKEVADQLGMSVTFMAKPYADRAGSSSHVHVSLWKDGESAFPGDIELGPVRGSDVFRWFLGGWMAHAPEMMVLYAPTVNSYKRYESGSWAPTRLAWCHDNRTAGFRVVGQGSGLRIECRLPGADCNPYLVYAAALASGLDGIAQKTEPPPLFEGDVYAAEELPEVPKTLRDATDLFESSEFAKRALGEAVVEHYTHFFRTEQAAFDGAVTDWERQRYFERI